MAGYIFNFNNMESLIRCAVSGVYSTILSTPKGYWYPHHEGTFADYSTMKPGDNIYFFSNRRIYGIGELVNIANDCKFANFKDASIPKPFYYDDLKESLLWDEGEYSVNQRWLCTFEPSPHFFKRGVDMDDVLASNPSAFRMLRAFWRVSFIKFDDDENQAFKDILLKSNQDALKAPIEDETIFPNESKSVHAALRKKILSNDYDLNIAPILTECATGSVLKHEMALEAGLLFQLSESDVHTLDIFGDWDYLSHQVVASPFKHIDWMDKMDIFGFSYIPGFSPTKSEYFIAELKIGKAKAQDVEQMMKYVDWVKDEYCFGDYSMINAFLVTSKFDEEVMELTESVADRKFTVDKRPAKSLEWKNLKLVEYSYNPSIERLDFRLVR